MAILQRSGDLVGLEARARDVVARVTEVGPFAQPSLAWVAMSLAERVDREGALATATRGRRAFPLANHWTGFLDSCELWCMALLDQPDWALRFQECEHFVPVARSPHFGGRRWFALFLVLSHVAQGELEAAARLYPVLRQALDDGWRVGPLQPSRDWWSSPPPRVAIGTSPRAMSARS